MLFTFFCIIYFIQDIDEDLYWAVILDWISCSSQPLSETENFWFQQVTLTLNPDAPSISAKMLHFDMPQEVEQVERLIVKLLEVSWLNCVLTLFLFNKLPTAQDDCSCIACTTDTWTTWNGHYSFAALTGHWIGKDWTLKSVLLDFIHIQGQHTGDNLAEHILEALQRLGIVKKASFIFQSEAV